LAFSHGLRALGIACLIAIAGITSQAAPASAATAPIALASRAAPSSITQRGARVVRIAKAQRGKRYVRGAVGPRAFDCSGLVRYAYRRAHVGGRLGGGHSARAMLRWGRAHHLTSRSNPRLGDVVIYGNGTHAAIWIGNGRVISALNPRQGIRITRLHALGSRFTAFIHTHLDRAARHAHRNHHPRRARYAVTRTAVNVRTGHSTATRVVGVAGRGRHLRVVGSARHHGRLWLHVGYRGHGRWVLAALTRAA